MNSLKNRLVKLETRSGEHDGGIGALIILGDQSSERAALFEYMALHDLTDEPSRIIFIAGIKPK